jgi:DNA-binding HxlR family transcriptional regulator
MSLIVILKFGLIGNMKTPSKAIDCPVAQASTLIGDMWVILIVRDLLKRPRRFCELQDSLITAETGRSINTRTLTQRLKTLESAGIVLRTEHLHEMPPKVEYALTKKGKALSEIMDKIKEYGKKYF